MADNKVGLEAVFDNEDFQRGVNSYNADVADASSRTEDAGSTMSAVWDGLATIGTYALEAIAAGAAALATELYLAVDAALDAEEVMTRVEFVVDNVAERTGVATEEVDALAGSLAQVLPIDDEVIASAIAMGLTFDGVNKDNIQPLISAAADLSQWTGKDLPGSMKTLSLAITDPDRAMRLFKEANITLTDAQEKTLKTLATTGDTAGTTQFILEQLANKGILGLAEVMGQTGKGKLTIMQTALGNLQESLGTPLLDALGSVFDRITEFANDPRTVDFFTNLGMEIGRFASNVLARLPDVFTVIDNLGKWFEDNKPLIIGVLAAIGTAIGVFALTVISSAISAAVALAPIILAMALIGAAAALLYTAWTENWGGIQELVGELWATIEPTFNDLVDWLQVNLPIALQYLSEFWTNVLLPAIQAAFTWIVTNLIPLWISLIQWLQVNVPVAIQYLSEFWTTTLLPALQAVWSWISTNLVPLFVSLIQWLQVNVPAAIATLSAFWTGTLLPAIQAVWSWISTTLVPLFVAIADLFNTVLTLAITALAGLWQNILLPALQAVGNWISANLMPIFQSLSDSVTNRVMPTLKPLADFLKNVLKSAFDGITSAIKTLTGWIDNLTSALNNIELPDALTPGSPTPFEIGLRGINEELKRLANAALPAVTHEMNVLGTVRDVPGANSAAANARVVNSSSNVNNYLFGASFNVNNSNGLLEILNGLA